MQYFLYFCTIFDDMETKRETYEALMPQIEALVNGETDSIANMANVAAVLHAAFGFWWTGFYRVTGEGLQVTGKTFAGHIACSSESKSEIVVPLWQDGEVMAVLDIDSKDYNTFDETDKIYLEQIAKIISKTR